MRLVITGHGTLGDHLPLLALALGLRDRGHHVTIAVNGWAARYFEREGLEVISCGPPFGPEEALANAELFEEWERWTLTRSISWARLMDMPRNYRDLRSACEAVEAEAIVTGGAQQAARFAAEDLELPWVCAYSQWEPFSQPPEVPPFGDARPLLLLLASPAFFTADPSDFPDLVQLGTCHYDGDQGQGWREPDAALRRFLDGIPEPGDPDDGGRPLVLLPGCNPVPAAAEVLVCHVRAARALGRRLVVQRGWTGLGRELLDDGEPCDHVFFDDVLPHDWLLARAAALIFPGRPGCLARALRAGCPLLAEPRAADDFFNARQILTLGLGSAMHPHMLTEEGLSQILAERVLTEDVLERCRELSTIVAGEDGASAACARIDTFLQGAGCPR